MRTNEAALAPTTVGLSDPLRRARPRLLFLCAGNSARSQIAEALVEHRSAAPSRHAAAHWSIADPAAAGEIDRATYPAVQRVADEIESREALLLADLRTRPLERIHHA